MTAAYRLKGIGWFGGCVAVVLGFYLVSLQVANERKKLEVMNKRIASAERDIRALETEFDTRANLVQLEKWNGDTLALSAPTAGQFVSDEGALAQIDVTAGAGADGMAMRTAQLVVPSGIPALAPQQPAMTLVAATAPMVEPQAAPVIAARVAAPADARASSGTIRTAAATIVRARPEVAMLDRKLLSDSTLGDIVATARAEAGKR